MTARVLVVCGSLREGSRTRALCGLAEAAVRAAGGAVKLLDLRELRLPILEMENAEQRQRPEVKRVHETAIWADGFVLGTPEYHGGISGALKNWLDYLYEELAGKLAGVLTVAGGAFGGDMSATATRNAFHSCHGFTLPFFASARSGDFDGACVNNTMVAERVQRLAHDVVRYAPLLRKEFERARALGDAVEAGFAGLYSDET